MTLPRVPLALASLVAAASLAACSKAPEPVTGETNEARVAHRADLRAELEAAFAADTADEWAERLNAAGVPAGPVNDVAEAYAFAERIGTDPVLELPDGVRTARSPLRLDGTPVRAERRPPRLGEHDAELRDWLQRP